MIKKKLYEKMKMLLEVYSLREVLTKLQINTKIEYFYSILSTDQQAEIADILNEKKNRSKRLKRFRLQNNQPINLTYTNKLIIDALLVTFPPAISADSAKWINVNEITVCLCNQGISTNMVHVGKAIKQINYISKHKKIGNSKLKVYGIKN